MVLLLILTYQLLKKFPVAMVAIYVLPLLLAPISGSAITVEEEEVVDNIEISLTLNEELPQKSKKEVEEYKNTFSVPFNEVLPECSYIISSYHKLFILFQCFSIDKFLSDYRLVI